MRGSAHDLHLPGVTSDAADPFRHPRQIAYRGPVRASGKHLPRAARTTSGLRCDVGKALGRGAWLWQRDVE